MLFSPLRPAITSSTRINIWATIQCSQPPVRPKRPASPVSKSTASRILNRGPPPRIATALGKVMRGQRQYDQDTVADITTMVKAMMDAGLLTELDNFSVKQILTKVKDSTGKNDITTEANKLIDIMLKHQLRRGKRAFEQQLKVKGMRQDSRGVVVQNIKDY